MEHEARRIAALLDRRTVALAARVRRGASTEPPPLVPQRAALIVWELGGSLYGIGVDAVAAVLPFAGCARVPTREPACLGVIGQAGRFYSVIDMRRLLGAADEGAAAAAPGHLLLLRGPAPHFALGVGRVLGSFDFPAEGPALELDGRLVARFDPALVTARLLS